MNVTDEQLDLLRTVVGVYNGGCRGEFLLAESFEGTALVYDDRAQPNIEINAAASDFERLASEDLLDVRYTERGTLRGKPTAKGVRLVASGGTKNATTGSERWTVDQKVQIALDYLRTKRARCPRDGSSVKVADTTADGGPPFSIDAYCPLCGDEMDSDPIYDLILERGSTARAEATEHRSITADVKPADQRLALRADDPSSAPRSADADAGIIDRRNVFVVHGRNAAARAAMFDFLRSVDLHPLEWSSVVAATGQGSPYIGEVLKKGFEMAQAVVVLMTGDDEARLLPAMQRSEDPRHEREFTPQARPNVLIEVGMALGMDEQRTIVVELGELRPASDLLGRHTIRMNNSAARRQDLVNRLVTAGCPVVDTGYDWHHAGDFGGAILPIESSSGATTAAAEIADEELTDDEKNLLVLMLYSGQSCRTTSAGPQAEHIETDEAGLYDPSDPEVAVSYLLALHRLQERELVNWGSAGAGIVRYHLTSAGMNEAGLLRAQGRRMDLSGFPEPHSRRSRY